MAYYSNIMLLAVHRTLANYAENTLVSPNYASYHQTYAIQQNTENIAGQITTKQGTNSYLVTAINIQVLHMICINLYPLDWLG